MGRILYGWYLRNRAASGRTHLRLPGEGVDVKKPRRLAFALGLPTIWPGTRKRLLDRPEADRRSRYREDTAVKIACALTAMMLGLSGAGEAAGETRYARPELLLEPSVLAKPEASRKFVILDVRPQDEYVRGHVPKAHRVDHDAWKKAYAEDKSCQGLGQADRRTGHRPRLRSRDLRRRGNEGRRADLVDSQSTGAWRTCACSTAVGRAGTLLDCARAGGPRRLRLGSNSRPRLDPNVWQRWS